MLSISTISLGFHYELGSGFQLKGSRDSDSKLMKVAYVLLYTTDVNSGMLIINIRLSFCLNVSLWFGELFLYHLQDQFISYYSYKACYKFYGSFWLLLSASGVPIWYIVLALHITPQADTKAIINIDMQSVHKD